MTQVQVVPNSQDLIRNLDELMRYVLKYIYVATNKWEKNEKMSVQEINLMERSMVWWHKVRMKELADKLERKIFLFKVTADQIDRDEEKFVREKLVTMGWMLKKNDEGYFDKRKEDFYYKSVDWRKFHRLPEAYTEKDFVLGARALEEWNQKNPELSGK